VGAIVGFTVGAVDGIRVGAGVGAVGTTVGDGVGFVGAEVGPEVGQKVRAVVGSRVSAELGNIDGRLDMVISGLDAGTEVFKTVGTAEAGLLGGAVNCTVANMVGAFVGLRRGRHGNSVGLVEGTEGFKDENVVGTSDVRPKSPADIAPGKSVGDNVGSADGKIDGDLVAVTSFGAAEGEQLEDMEGSDGVVCSKVGAVVAKIVG
jgi:hypothetical protein